jgi:hypothetical protein
VSKRRKRQDEVASSTTPHQNSKNAHRSHRGNLAAVGRRKGQADDAPLRRCPRAPIGASSRRVNAGAVRTLSLFGIFGPDQGTSRPSSPFCIKIFTAPNLFAVFRLLRRYSSPSRATLPGPRFFLLPSMHTTRNPSHCPDSEAIDFVAT